MNQKSYLTTFIAIVVAFVLFIVGFFIFTPREIQVGQENQVSNPSTGSTPKGGQAGQASGCEGDSCALPSEDGLKSFTGRVQKVGVSTVQQGTYQLEDGSGKILAYLNAADDKLKLVEGMEVEVRGKVTRTVEGNLPLVMVEEVRFK